MPLTKKQKTIISNEVTLHNIRLTHTGGANEMDVLRNRLYQTFSDLLKSHEKKGAKISKQNDPESSMKNMLERCVENLLTARIAELSLTRSVIETGGHSQSNLRTTLRLAEKAIDFNNHLIIDMKNRVERDNERGPTTGTLDPTGLQGPAPLTPREVGTAEPVLYSYAPLKPRAVRPEPPCAVLTADQLFRIYPPGVVRPAPPITPTEAVPLPTPTGVGEDVTPKA